MHQLGICYSEAVGRAFGKAHSSLTLALSLSLPRSQLTTLANLERLQFENSLQENPFYHESMATGYQSKSYQVLGDLDAVWTKTQEAREKVRGGWVRVLV